MTEFKVPELGENVATGDVLRVLVNVGDTIARDQPVVELETDKATIEVPSSVAGVVKDIRVKEGDKVKVGSVILTVDDDGAGAGAPAEQPEGEESTETEPPPERGAAREGSKAERNRAGQTSEQKPEQTPEQKPEKVVSMPRSTRAEPVPAKAAEPASPALPQTREPAAAASPGVRRLAREIGVEINDVQGSGPHGRIAEADVKEHARRLLTSTPSHAPATSGAGPALPDFTRWGDVERQPMSNIRRTTSQRLSHAWSVVAHVTQFDKADITSMEELRRKYREQVQNAGGNLTVTAMLVKVLATAVRQFPQFNSALDLQADEIIYKKYVHIGVAVDTDRGLLVPVVRNADQKNITEIAIEVHQLAEKARSRKLTREDMSGGGMTISNLGGIGGTYFTPIVNWPEVAILGVSRGIIEPVWRNDTFEPRQLLPLSLSYDHRVIDGADAMRFLRWVVEAIEQPFLLSLLG